MKFNKLPVVPLSMCAAIGLSAFALPLAAAGGLKSVQGKVMEQETPSEYMEDFIAQESPLVIMEEIPVFLSEEEMETYKMEAVRSFKEHFGLDIPKELSFDYEAKQIGDNENVRLELTWTEKVSSGGKQDILFSASFNGNTISQVKEGLAELTRIQGENALDEVQVMAYSSQVIAALEKDLGWKVSEDYAVQSVISTYVNDPVEDYLYTDGIKINLRIVESETEDDFIGYHAEFRNVDISKNTGRIKGLSKTGLPFYQYDANGNKLDAFEDDTIPEETKNEMLEKAKELLNKKDIATGGLRIASPNEEGIMFRFGTPEWVNEYRNIWVSVSYDMEIMGYQF